MWSNTKSKEDIIYNLVAEIEAYLLQLNDPKIMTVLEGLQKWATGPVRPVASRGLPACAHLDPALRAMGKPSLAKAITDARAFLHWVSYDAYPRADIGAAFVDNHAFASIIGEGCPIEALDFDLGLFIIAPHLFYRDHHHAAPELYAPLTGPHGWRFKPGDPLVWKEADVPVWNNPWEPHATMTGDTPFLAIFCWTRDTSQPAKIIPSPDWPTLENPS
jgi:Dimethlysulfonioproprionate lyase